MWTRPLAFGVDALGTDRDDLVAEAMPRPEQQQVLFRQLLRRQGGLLRPAVIARQHHHEFLVVQRPGGEAVQVHRQGDDGDVQLVVAQLLQQHGGEVFLDHQRHQRRAPAQLRHQAGQQVGADRVNGADPQRSGQFVLAFAGDILDPPGLGQHAPRLGDDALADRRRPRFAADALEQRHT